MASSKKYVPPTDYVDMVGLQDDAGQEGVADAIQPGSSVSGSNSGKTSGGSEKSSAPAPAEVDTTAVLNTINGGYTTAQGRVQAAAANKNTLITQTGEAAKESLTGAYEAYRAGLEENRELSLSALKADSKQALDAMNGQIDRALQQAYLTHMQAERDLPGQLEAAGITGGAAESTLAGLQNSYGNDRNTLEVTRADKLAEINNNYVQQATQIRTNYNTQSGQSNLDQANAERDLELLLMGYRIDAMDTENSQLSDLDQSWLRSLTALL